MSRPARSGKPPPNRQRAHGPRGASLSLEGRVDAATRWTTMTRWLQVGVFAAATMAAGLAGAQSTATSGSAGSTTTSGSNGTDVTTPPGVKAPANPAAPIPGGDDATRTMDQKRAGDIDDRLPTPMDRQDTVPSSPADTMTNQPRGESGTSGSAGSVSTTTSTQ